MKIYRFKHESSIFYGVLEKDILHVISGSIFRKFRIAPKKIPIGDVWLLPSVLPSKIVAVGRNYRDHA
ncbi:MAG: DUF2437 domain-containing protein, partial [Candidatus Aminicenantes bacterium]|nr:DUF2437 domain-containing protein [Candidatus Aminicenantes bacterium]